jgi:hypothetical protein
MQIIQFESKKRGRDFMATVEKDGNTLGYMISVTRHIFSIVKYEGRWKYCDNHNIYDFNMDEFVKDFYDHPTQIFHNMSKGLFKKNRNRKGKTYEYYSTNLPEHIKMEAFNEADTSPIQYILRVVKHDASKLSFRKALYNLLPGHPENTNVICYLLYEFLQLYHFC